MALDLRDIQETVHSAGVVNGRFKIELTHVPTRLTLAAEASGSRRFVRELLLKDLERIVEDRFGPQGT